MTVVGPKWELPWWRFPSGSRRPINSLIGIIQLIGDDKLLRNARRTGAAFSASPPRTKDGAIPCFPSPRCRDDSLGRGDHCDHKTCDGCRRTVAAPSWEIETRRMLNALAELEFRPGRASPLVKLCEAGACYGWRQLEAAIKPKILAVVSPKAGTSLRRDLRRSLERLTRPCLKLERTSFGLALNSIGISAGPTDAKLAERMFLGDKPSHRLFALFKEFPVLAGLWSQLITQWREHVMEVVLRFTEDRAALSRAFFGGRSVSTIKDFRCSLSDPHCHGRRSWNCNSKLVP